MSASGPWAIPSNAKHRNDSDSDARRIYILGIGNIGTFVAHSLASLPDAIRPPITLLLHRKSLLDAWKERGETLDLLRYEDGAMQPRGGFDVELVEIVTQVPRSSTSAPEQRDKQSNGHIRNLIVSVLAPQTVSALAPIHHRLGAASSVLFLQNGMGSPNEAAEKFFPSADKRPQFMQGIVMPGGWTLAPFVVKLAALGKIPIGTIPQRALVRGEGTAGSTRSDENIESSRYLLDTLSAAPILGVERVEYAEVFQRQLEKLLINALANPLTGILDQSNDVLLRPTLTPLISALIAETASIIRSLPELRDVPEAQERFATKKMEEMVAKTLQAVKANTTSMCQHLRMGKKTEIEYINGYIVKRAREMGAPCELNSAMRQLVLTKEAVGLERQK